MAIAWEMPPYGLRRGEVFGLRWCDVDLIKPTITIQKTRSVLDGRSGADRDAPSGTGSDPREARGVRSHRATKQL
ncbi:site-specific integrase [Actinoplanes siamensis]|uniref:Uncharacterized protein n=1 Tax=Actinoplanes siamensis TaxID=1223317 RepID=A0A919TLE8_9ACTN|nr:hypothetical protein [Actinoplanes siamensis]GIF07116.1 hypothetical protein Asi03nite_46540 [Actinoplanes siamensis]